MEYAPYGDFHNLVREYRLGMDERLVRTFFHQLIDGLEYLHSQGVYHLDIKLSNLLLGTRFQLKIADFDMGHKKTDTKPVRSRGTKNFRAPELVMRECRTPAAADIYSAGIVLFTLFTGGYHPHAEEESCQGIPFYDLLTDNIEKFWDSHCKVQKKPKEFFNDDFKELFEAMTKADADYRIGVEGVKRTKWYNAPIFSAEETADIMSRYHAW